MSIARRFYQHAAATPEHGVALDERKLRTPGGLVFTAPTPALAQVVAAEWAAQGEQIIPASMPLTQLAFAAIDWTPKSHDKLADYVAAYAETDLLCHRAESPADLAERQAAAWDGLLDWCAATIGAHLPVVIGVVASTGHQGEVAKIRAAAAALDDFRLTALAQTTGLAGSAVVALALLYGAVTPDAAFEAAALDDLWSQQRWGADAEAQARLERQRDEFENIARFVKALSA